MTEPQSEKPRLLVAKGTFEAMRGAERDLIRNLPALAKFFDVTMATLELLKNSSSVVGKTQFHYLNQKYHGNKVMEHGQKFGTRI